MFVLSTPSVFITVRLRLFSGTAARFEKCYACHAIGLGGCRPKSEKASSMETFLEAFPGRATSLLAAWELVYCCIIFFSGYAVYSIFYPLGLRVTRAHWLTSTL